MLRDQQQAAAWAPPEENVITKKTGRRHCGGLTEGLRPQEWNETCVGGDYVPPWSQEGGWEVGGGQMLFYTTGCISNVQSKRIHGVPPSVMQEALCCCTTRCYYTQSSWDNRRLAQRRAAFWQPNHTENGNNEDERDREREKYFMSTLPAVSIRLQNEAK